ncbi:DUF2357 domain-containing protein [Clostridium tagluense]|uniref:DUF2357 domain-containing protein n=1 Tax=Clostridium tagluense TaxID=360422 RepID=UPI001CF252AF|nr:DUF2357 domain-containing protein [Clostridium tagluense]MCB2310434.1 DUF2357 domain-containing protein [Clostridium tagluense]MCB2315400.1 DUF2357 domain-containing protein [Clostridium tagluense]MCB2320252.1 DUF2357 domain-containing protein [Clostridium tagluense]MCB2325142.1 DUF2357 domain-containing protein [Clostridium tagluense]MCB2329994.1 DUF2357 domain-containing protein [Clostridium tagluense]
MECTLILQTKLIGDLNIILTERVENNILINSEVCGTVYSDMDYNAKVEFDEEIQDIKIYINDIGRECFYEDGKIWFKDAQFLNKKIFLNYFGYVSFTIHIKTAEANYEFYSNYLDVAVRDNISSDQVRKMVAYIAKNSQKYLFKDDSNIKDFADVEKNKNKNTDTEISMLENILFEYENNFKYFKTGSKYKIISNYIVDDFEKLEEIKSETIQYIISNPQNLITVNHNTGIVYNKLNLQPKKTLINKNELCYNIYENQVVLGFLKHIYNSILSKLKDVESKINNSQRYPIKAEYISSSNEIYKEVNKTLEKYKIKLYEIKKKVQQLYFMYKQVLKCEEITVSNIPKPSSIFMKIQNYRKIYKVIRNWFESGNYDLRNELMILTFSEASQIYEYYVLFKISSYITDNGYYLKEARKYVYKLRKSAKYENTRFENTFIFEKGKINITVYYQPVIYLEPVVYDNNIGLYRNNDISFDGGKAQYYTPDYVVKISENELSEFIILDAKWANIKSVIDYSFKKIIYKYIFSTSTINNKDKINKVWVINGKELQNQEEYVCNFYNSKFKERDNELTPSAKILTLTPNVDELIEKSSLNELFYEIKK